MQGSGFIGILVAALACGCSGPGLDVPTTPKPTWTLELEPALDPGMAALAFRGRVRGVSASAEPWLFRGQLSDYYSRALKRGEVPAALRERAVPLRFWREGDDDCWLQPLEWLEPDVDYTLGATGVGALRLLRASAGPARTRRLFPPPGVDKSRGAVVCGAPVAQLPAEILLEPGAVPVRVQSGQLGPAAADCITLSVDGRLGADAVAPPTVAGALLEPSPWLPEGAAVAQTVAPCADGQAFHGACLEISDDRIFVTPQGDEQLWSVAAPNAVVVSLAAGQRGVLASGLEPGSEVALRGQILSSSGRLEPFETTLTTLPARRHLILNEVLANPLGPEPAGEWIELFNDSARPTSLSRLWLEDASGHVALPDGELGPGELVLLVGPDFRVSGLDVPLAEGARTLELASLGARGLSNSGEPLLLVGPEGVVSRFPLLAAPHAGRSLARRAPDAADDLPSSFAEHGRPGASPGAPNRFDDESP